MRPTILLFLCIGMLASLHTRAQDQMPIVELQRFISGKVWVIEEECVHDSCYDNNIKGYYWPEDIFDSRYGAGSTSWCFTMRHAFFFKEFATSNPELIITDNSPVLCVIAVNSESTQFTVHYTSETGAYEMTLTRLDERSFILSGPSWGSAHTCMLFRSVDVTPELTLLMSQDAKGY